MDDIYKQEVSFQGHTDEMVVKTTQPTEDIILERASELRKNPGAIRDLGKGTQSWGRQIASIPIIMYQKAIKDGYNLNSKDSNIAGREMHRFLQSTEGKMCLVQGK